jgi:hypothetical protein
VLCGLTSPFAIVSEQREMSTQAFWLPDHSLVSQLLEQQLTIVVIFSALGFLAIRVATRGCGLVVSEYAHRGMGFLFGCM